MLNTSCPGCGHNIKKLIFEARPDDMLTCPGCGAGLNVKIKDAPDTDFTSVEEASLKIVDDMIAPLISGKRKRLGQSVQHLPEAQMCQRLQQASASPCSCEVNL